jgi:hypothetical protein
MSGLVASVDSTCGSEAQASEPRYSRYRWHDFEKTSKRESRDDLVPHAGQKVANLRCGCFHGLLGYHDTNWRRGTL